MATENGGFKGVSKEDHEVLLKAARMYETLTGEPVKAAGQIPVLPATEADPEAKAKAAEEELKASAEATQKREEAQQAERRVQAGLDDKGQPKEGPPEPVLAPMAARLQEGATSRGKKGEPPAKESKDKEPVAASRAART